MSLLCRLKNLVHKGILKEKDLERIVIIPKDQQPCEYAVNREDLEECQELMTDINGDTVYAVRMSDIRKLPPVTPKPKTGHWIYREDMLDYKCSECGRAIETKRFENPYIRYPYCHCGAKMIEPQESEE